MVAHFCYGFDGCGSHRAYNGPTYFGSGIANGSIIFGGMSLSTITFKDKDGVLYKVPHMASSGNERPVLLVDGKEDDKMVTKIFEIFDKEHKEAVNPLNPIVLDLGDGKKLTIHIKLKCSQMDGKLIKMAQGRLGAYCLMCTKTREQAKNPELIAAGMIVDLSTEEINATWEKFKSKNQDGEYGIDTKNIKVDVRGGQTHQPKTVNIQICLILAPLHARLRSKDWFLDVFARFSSGHTKYLSREAATRILFNRYQAEYKANSEMICGIKLGSTSGDTSNTCKKFFQYENREKILKLLDLHAPSKPVNPKGTQMEDYEARMDEIERFKSKWRQVLQNISVIIRILNSDLLVDVEAFDKFCTETALMAVAGEFNWVWFFPTVHQYLAHGAEVIKDNDCRGLKNQSEEGSEASHKTVKHLRDKAARKISIPANLSDVFDHCWIDTDFTVRSNDRTGTCSHCNTEGHFTISCPKKKPKETTNNPDDEILARLTLEEDSENTMAEED